MSKYVKNTDIVQHKWAGQYVQPASYYQIETIEQGRWAEDAQLMIDIANGIAVVATSNSGTEDITDVNLAINYIKDLGLHDDKGRNIVATTIFGVNEFRFRGKGIRTTVTAGETGNLDHTLAEMQYLNGGRVILENHSTNDELTFQVVHPQAGVLDEYISTWQVDIGQNLQESIILPYIAALPAGLILRVAYSSTGGADVIVKINYMLQKDF